MQDHALYQISQIRQIELSEKAKLASGSLMRLAGASAVPLITQLLASSTTKKIAILAGPGDNGGDAFELAFQLSQSHEIHSPETENTTQYILHVIACGDTSSYSEEAKQALQRAQSAPMRWLNLDQAQQFNPAQYDLIVDGLFGIGLSRPITGAIATLIQSINKQAKCPVIALDIPSGIHADTGQIVLANPVDHGEANAIEHAEGIAIVASHTISFIANKPGLHTAQGKDHAGLVSVAHLGINLQNYPPAFAQLTDPDAQATLIKVRKHDSNKGSYGDVLIVGGCQGMQGAPLLAGRAALLTGAGRVYVALLEMEFGIRAAYPELMIRAADRCDFSQANLVLGPGMGRADSARELLQLALHQAPTLLLDADALNLLADDQALTQSCRERSIRTNSNQKKSNTAWRTLLTPHPLEAARLLHCSLAEIQADRCKAAQMLARKFHATIILKGAGSIIANEESITINSSGNPALATAGTGDVLAGVCGSLLAQGLSAFDAARLGAFIHGLGAERCVEKGIGPIGLSASELIPEIRAALNHLVYTHS